MCIRFHPAREPITRFDVFKKLGNNTVNNLVGDIIAL